jgi:SAM-dependent methyltransferase
VTNTTADYLRANMEHWESRHDYQSHMSRERWSVAEPTWGVFAVPESVAHIFPDDLAGSDVVELGCGTAYISAWLARRGARPIGVDPTDGQLRIARECQDEFSLHFPLVRAAGEEVPLRDASFDLVFSEYGAAIWADPYRWIPEAARLLRPGGRLVFLGNSTLMMLCAPDIDGIPVGDRLLRAQFGMHRFEWPDDPTVEFHLSHGDWIRLFRANGFEVEDLMELRAPAGATMHPVYNHVTPEWAQRWPCEEVWVARRQ